MSITPEKRLAIKHLINTSSPYSTTSPVWSIVNEGVTDLSEDFNADTEDLQYINEERKTTIVKNYAPSFTLSAVMVKGDPVNTWIREKTYSLPTGSDADCEYIRFNILDNVPGQANTYKAIRQGATVSVTSMGGAAGDTAEMEITISARGEPTKGTVTLDLQKSPVEYIFTANDTTLNNSIEFTVMGGGSALSGASVTFNNTTITTGNDGKATFPINSTGTYEYTIGMSGYNGVISNVTVDNTTTSPITKTITLTESTTGASEYSLR